MQSKISAFFKSSVSAPKSVDPPPPIDGDNDELTIWEKKEHQIFNTYQRRRSNSKMYALNRINFCRFDFEKYFTVSFIYKNLSGKFEKLN